MIENILFQNKFHQIIIFLQKHNDFKSIYKEFNLEKSQTVNDFKDDYFKLSKFIRSYFLLNSYGYLIKIKTKERILITITDIVSSIKLFYNINKIIGFNELTTTNLKLNEQSLQELNASGYTHGNNTLYKNIFTQEADSIYIWKDNKLTKKNIFNFRDNTLLFNKNWYSSIGKNVKRKVKNLNKKGILISLSGGLDSRIILMSCMKAKIRNIICFSYGPKNNPDAKIAKEICEKLNIKWINCTDMKPVKEIYNNFLENYQFINSVPMDEAFEALNFLKEKFSKDYLLINGQTGDFTTGGHLLNDNFFKNKKELKNYIKNKFFKMRIQTKEFPMEKILTQNLTLENNYLFNVEEFEWKNRQAKYVTGVIKSYEFFGFESYMPLWDGAFTNFWRQCSSKLLEKQNLYAKKINIFSKKFDLIEFQNMQDLYYGNIFLIKILGKLLYFNIIFLSKLIYIILLFKSKYRHRLIKHNIFLYIKSFFIFDHKLPFGRFCLLLTIMEMNNRLKIYKK